MEKRGYKIYAWFYQKFLLVLVVSLMVVAALSCAVYGVAKKTIKKMAFEKSEVEIRYFIRDIDSIFQEAEFIELRQCGFIKKYSSVSDGNIRGVSLC